MRSRRKARVFSSTPFLLDFSRGRGFRKIIFSKLRPSVLPSVQKNRSICLESVDFAPPKVMGSEKKDISLWSRFLPSNQAILFRKKGLRQKIASSCQSVFFCTIHNSHICCCVTPTGAKKYEHAFPSP